MLSEAGKVLSRRARSLVPKRVPHRFSQLLLGCGRRAGARAVGTPWSWSRVGVEGESGVGGEEVGVGVDGEVVYAAGSGGRELWPCEVGLCSPGA